MVYHHNIKVLNYQFSINMLIMNDSKCLCHTYVQGDVYIMRVYGIIKGG